MMSQKLFLGKVAPVFKGSYQEDTEYQVMHAVEYEGNTWVALDTVENVVPGTNDKYWAPLAVGEVSEEAIKLITSMVSETILESTSFVEDPDYVRTENNFTSYYEELVIQIGHLKKTLK